MDSWVVNLANGATKVEEWVPGQLSPWQRLMEYCKKEHTYVTNLRLTIGTRTVACDSNAVGYWQAHGMPSVQGVECDEELHKWRGIGYVKDDIIYITWGARDPHTHNVVFWQDARSAKNQAQVIWSRPTIPVPILSDEPERGEAKVRNLKGFQDKIVEEAGGIKELYVPEHHH
jgi:hypothetical protein